jgi:periplasmic divalent cation tolerance protein
MTGFIQVVTTTGNRADAERISQILVDRRLAACVQVAGPIQSTYHWQGRVETAEEWQCVAKTSLDRFEELRQAVISAHPYDVPEIIATPIVTAHQPYLDWMQHELSR